MTPTFIPRANDIRHDEWPTPAVREHPYPEDRLIDGAIGAYETPNDVGVEVGVESDLDFQAAWPIIWPQTTVLYQTDDNIIEINQTSADTPYL